LPGIVYVVDDDASLRTTIQQLLEAAGYRVITYASAQQLLDQPLGPSRAHSKVGIWWSVRGYRPALYCGMQPVKIRCCETRWLLREIDADGYPNKPVW
jgi:hypothetical protein